MAKPHGAIMTPITDPHDLEVLTPKVAEMAARSIPFLSVTTPQNVTLIVTSFTLRNQFPGVDLSYLTHKGQTYWVLPYEPQRMQTVIGLSKNQNVIAQSV